MEHEGDRDERGIWAAEDVPIRPRTGMFWMDDDMKRLGKVWEVVAYDQDTTHLLEWRTEGEVVEGATMRLGPGEGSQALGAGVMDRREWSGILERRDWGNKDGYLVETTRDRHKMDGSNVCEVNAIRQRVVQTVWPSCRREELCNPQWEQTMIYT